MTGDNEREPRWAPGTREELRSFPKEVRWVFGRALYRAQLGGRHEIASLMKGRLRGVVKLATVEEGDAYRLYYTLKCPGYLYVLYCHKKKSKRGIGIPKREEGLIVRRYRDAVEECKKRLEGR